MERPDLWQLVEQTLREDCGVRGPISPQSRFAQDLGLDSLALLALATRAEDRFQILLQEDPDHPPASVAEFLTLLERRLQEEGK